MRPSSYFELAWALYRLQLAALEATTALFWATGQELWRSQAAEPLRSGPSLAEMIRETRQDTYDGDGPG